MRSLCIMRACLAPRASLSAKRHNRHAWVLDLLSARQSSGPLTLLRHPRFLHNVLAVFETYTRAVFCWPLSLLRAAGIKYAMEYMKSEDIQTNWICIGPVNKVLNMLCVWVDNGLAPSDSFYKHVARLDDYLWVAEDGMKMQGYNGSQCWDTSFAIQAVVEGGMGAEFDDLCDRVYGFLERTQILSTEVSQATEAHAYEHVDLRKQYYRHVSKGGWPFSTSAHGMLVICMADSRCNT